VFQIESRAQMSLLPRLKPSHFYDLVVQVAIIRPGPIQGGMVHPFVRRRHGKEKVQYPHPDLENILGKTLGVPIFQEQIMQIASTLGGFTPGEADELRRLMSSSWKKPEIMKGLRRRLLNGMLHHGINLKEGERIYKTIEGFASYGFPESHAASFALLTYASCYLKCHYPEFFVCSLLNSQPMGFYSPRSLIGDAQRKRVHFLPLSINKSQYDYQIEESSDHPQLCVRLGFRAIYGLKKKHMEDLLKERELNGPFLHLEDLIRRTDLARQVLLLLASAGSFSDWQLSPRSALWTIQSLSFDSKSFLFGRPKESFHLNSTLGSDVSSLPGVEIIPSESEWDQLQRNYRATGFALHS
ncbi:MAG: error-prone DNA polymerase, partial [Bdellovibrionales bacterium]|nr:error-prone DNA polymerase [Bdellovibrionales bacterium]